MFGFSSPREDLSLIKSLLVPNLVNKRNIEPTNVRKGDQLTFCPFADIQHLDVKYVCWRSVMSLFGLESVQHHRSQMFLTSEWLNHAAKPQIMKSHSFDDFLRQLRSYNSFDAAYENYVNNLKNWTTTEQAVITLKLSKQPPREVKKHQNLQKKCEKDNWVRSKTFSADIAVKILFQFCKQCQDLNLTTTKTLICQSLVVF